jgi:hypothetical protein
MRPKCFPEYYFPTDMERMWHQPHCLEFRVHYFIFFCLFLLQHTHFKITKKKKKKNSHLSLLCRQMFPTISPSLAENQRSQETLSFPSPAHPLSHYGQRPPLPLTVSLPPSLVSLSHQRKCSATGEERICDLG